MNILEQNCKMLTIEEFKQLWACPITHEVPLDPVVIADGFTYERAAIETWLAIKQTSPMTNELLQNTRVTPNRAALRIIALFGLRD